MIKNEDSMQNAIIFVFQQKREELKLKREIAQLYVEFSKERRMLMREQNKKEVAEQIFKLAKTIKEKENALENLQSQKQISKTKRNKTLSKILHQNTQNQNERTN